MASEGSLFTVMAIIGTTLPAAILLIFACITGNAGNMNIMAWFIPFLLFLGIATPPISGTYIADYLINRPKDYDKASLEKDSSIKPLTFVAWGGGFLVGFCTVNVWFTLSGIPSLYSILIASFGYYLFSKMNTSKKKLEANNA